ncbi:hypothetical protein KEM52_005540 [Ascosphaera acerosa]|nr:hypothetical protein KEM52_005540 [Ascosphaera acerosa]
MPPVVEGDEKAARELSRKEPGTCFWEPLNQDGEGTMTSFKQFKKTLSSSDKSFTQLCLCNPCGLYLYKMEKMRPENMWNKSAQKAKRKKGKARLAPVPPPGPLLTGRPLLPHLPPPLAPLTDPRPSTDAAGNDGSGLELMPVSVKLSGSSPATSPTRMPANDKLQTDGCMMAATSPDVNDCPEDVTTQGRASTAALSSPGGAAQVKATIVIGEDGGATIQTSPTLSHPFAATFASTRAATTVLPSIEGNDEAEQSASLSVSQSRQAQKRATSEQPPGSAEKRRRMNTDAAIEALKKAIQASPARRLAGSGNKSIPNATAATDLDLQELTPKPVCRKLFPSAAAKSQTPQLAATATSSSRTVNGGAVQSSPVKRLTNRNEMTIGNATATRNHGASAIESPTVGALDAQIIDDIFNSQTTAALDLAIPMTPSKQQQHHQFSVPSHSNGQPSARTSPSKGLAQSKNGLVPSVCNEPSPSSPRTRTAIEATTSASPGSAHHIQPGAGSGMAIQPPATLPMSQPENALATPIDIDSFISQIAPYPAASPVGAGGPPLFPDWDTWVDAMATTAVDGSTRPTDFLAAPTDYLSQATTTGQAQALDDLLGSLPPAAPPDDQSATLFDFFMTMTPPGEEAGASTDLQPTAQHQQSQLTGIKPGDAGVQQASGAATPGTQLCTEAPELAVAPAMLALAPPVTASTGSAAHAAT